MRYLLLLLTIILLTACGHPTNPADNISFGQAFTQCWHYTGYVVWVIVALIGGAAAGYLIYRDYKRNQDWSIGMSVALFVLLVLVVAAFIATPASIAANTTVEQAARGVYIR